MNNSDVVIIGAGLAGLTAAIHLSKIGIKVTIVEKHTFPRHKVCGEYISNEVLPYLEWLNIDLAAINPVQISKISFSGVDGKLINGKLPLGGFGISRYAFDFLLYNKAIANGCKFLENAVTEVAFDDNKFAVSLGDGSFLIADIVIGAFGKRSNIDQKMQRSFIKKKSPWLAVKAHYSGTFEDDTVGLHNFDGGYCGVSKVENDQINICYLADYDSFKRYKNIDDYQKAIVSGNPNLQKIFSKSKMIFETPLTISQISFEEKLPVENHILMIGDTAGLIHPLCGNGMAMAIHSAKIVSELIQAYHSGTIKNRVELEAVYTSQWNAAFKSRMKMGRTLASVLRRPRLSKNLIAVVSQFPSLLQFIISKTHGKPLTVS